MKPQDEEQPAVVVATEAMEVEKPRPEEPAFGTAINSSSLLEDDEDEDLQDVELGYGPPKLEIKTSGTMMTTLEGLQRQSSLDNAFARQISTDSVDMNPNMKKHLKSLEQQGTFHSHTYTGLPGEGQRLVV
jgi:hypothetical protein